MIRPDRKREVAFLLRLLGVQQEILSVEASPTTSVPSPLEKGPRGDTSQ